MFNKKAQIASTMTWFIAFIIVFFIMALFLSGVASLNLNFTRDNPEISFDEISASYLDNKLNYEYLVFLEENREVFSEWVDDGFVLEYLSYVQGERDEKMEAVCSSIRSSINDLDLSSGDLQIISKKDPKEIININNKDGRFTCIPLAPNVQITNNLVRVNVFFLSDDENVVEVVAHE